MSYEERLGKIERRIWDTQTAVKKLRDEVEPHVGCLDVRFAELHQEVKRLHEYHHTLENDVWLNLRLFNGRAKGLVERLDSLERTNRRSWLRRLFFPKKEPSQ
jgi:Fe-S-cluster formation regulator IscX/YfhJ